MKVGVLGDMHNPWTLWPLIERAVDHFIEVGVHRIVQTGDLFDGHSWSVHPKSSRSPGASREWSMNEKALERLQRTLPNVPFHILRGNHDLRIARRASEILLPDRLMRPFSELFQFANWKWHESDEPLVLDGVAYVHGHEERGRNGVRLAESAGIPVVHGHQHKDARIEYRRNISGSCCGR